MADLDEELGLDDELPRQAGRLSAAAPIPSMPASPTPGVAKPNATNSTPPLTLRGISPQASQATTRDQGELDRLKTSGSGISQVSSPTGRGILRGLNTVGSIAGAVSPLARNLMTAIPGTEEHHQQLIGKSEKALGADLGQEEKEAGIGEKQAQGENAVSEANARNNPQPKEEEQGKTVTTDEGIFQWNPATKSYDTRVGDAPGKEEIAGKTITTDAGVMQWNPQTKRYDIPAGGAPEKPVKTEKVTRVVNGVPHEVLVNAETGADIKDEGQTKIPGESAQDKRAANESAQVERESRQNIRKAEGEYRNTQKSVGQLTSAIDQATDGNGLLTSFVPTMEVLGINAANGVHRISPVEAQAAQLPGGWAERFNAWYDKASSGKISPELVTEGKQLAHILLKSSYDRYKSTYNDENGIVSGYGVNDFNKRVPMIPSDQAGGPAVGTIEQGYRFKGGDPANQASWEKVQ